MQCGQPFQSANNAFNSCHQILPFCPQVTGEGEVTSIIFPDGTIQLYFIPKFRHDWTPYQYHANVANENNFNKPANTEYWFIRSTNIPNTIGFSTPSNAYVNCLSNQSSPNYCMNIPKYTADYYQKFHSDNTTSTTDIIYFYPNLRQSTRSQNSASIQTNVPTANSFCNNISGLCKKPCNCKVSFKIKETNSNECACQESSSSMSVDGVINTSKHNLKKKHKRFKHVRKNQDHLCRCRNIDKSDKIVTTYVDRASGNTHTGGRETQTMQKTKKSDIKTEIWVPMKKKSRKSKSSVNTEPECASCCYSENCTGDSTTETDGR